MRALDFFEDGLRSVASALAYRLMAPECPSLSCAKPAGCYWKDCGGREAVSELPHPQYLVGEGKLYLGLTFMLGVLVGLIVVCSLRHGRAREGGELCVRTLRGVRGALA